MATDVTLDWADGSYRFKLSTDDCVALERRFRCGIPTIWNLLRRVQEPTERHMPLATEIIRLGLTGGAEIDGKWRFIEPSETIERFVKPAAPAENWKLARVIVGAFMVGV